MQSIRLRASSAHNIRHFSQDSILRSLLANTGKLLGSNAISLGLGFVQSLIIARTLGVSNYGILGLVMTFTATVSQFVDSRIWETAIKYITQYQEQGDSTKVLAVIKLCYFIDLLTGISGFILIRATADIAAALLIKDPRGASLVGLYGLSILIAIPVGTSTAILRIGGRFNWLAIHGAGISALRLCAVVFVVILYGVSVENILYVYLVVALISMAVLFALSQYYARTNGFAAWYKTSFSSLKGDYKNIVQFTIITNVNGLLKLVQGELDILAVGFWLSVEDVGYLRLAKLFANAMAFVMAPLFGTISYPQFVQLWYRQEYSQLKRLFEQLTGMAIITSLCSLAVLFFGADIIICISAGVEYVPAVPLIQGFSIGAALAISVAFVRPLLLAAGYTRQLLIAFIMGSLVQLIFIIALLPHIGLGAAALAYISFDIVYVSLSVKYIKQVLFANRVLKS